MIKLFALILLISSSQISVLAQEDDTRWGTIKIEKKYEPPIEHTAADSPDLLPLAAPKTKNRIHYDSLNIFEKPQYEGKSEAFFVEYEPATENLTGEYVIFSVLIGNEGIAKNLHIIKTNNELLTRMVKQAIPNTTWRPATKKGMTYDCQLPHQIVQIHSSDE